MSDIETKIRSRARMAKLSSGCEVHEEITRVRSRMFESLAGKFEIWMWALPNGSWRRFLRRFNKMCLVVIIDRTSRRCGQILVVVLY